MAGRKHLQFWLAISLMCIAGWLMIAPNGMAQCGDADCSGSFDITDLAVFADHLFVSGAALGCPERVEFDGYHLVTARDFLMLVDGAFTCGETNPTPFAPSNNPDIYLVVNTNTLPAMTTAAYVTVDIVTTQPIRLLDLPVAVRINGTIPFSATSLTGTGCAWIPSDGVVRCFRNGNPAIPAGTTRLFSVFLSAGPYIDPVPITYSYIAQPPIQDAQPVRSAMVILPGPGYDTYEPGITIAPSCCVAKVGNVDCDPTDNADVGDLTALIDNLFVSFTPLCCATEANCDGDPANNVDIGDLTALIDNLFVSFTPLPACQ